MSDLGNESAEAWRDIDHCEGCDADDVPLRAIKMREGRRRMLCIGCFTQKLEDGEVDPSDPRVNEDGSVNAGIPSAPGQRGGQRE